MRTLLLALCILSLALPVAAGTPTAGGPPAHHGKHHGKHHGEKKDHERHHKDDQTRASRPPEKMDPGTPQPPSPPAESCEQARERTRNSRMPCGEPAP